MQATPVVPLPIVLCEDEFVRVGVGADECSIRATDYWVGWTLFD
jgi:hypothetical protein